MKYDVIIGILILCPMILGHMRGIVGATLHSLSWVAAAALGVLGAWKLSGPVGKYFLYDKIAEFLGYRFEGSQEALDAALDTLPGFLKGGILVDTEGAVAAFVAFLTNILVVVITYVAIVFLVKIVLRILVTPIVSKYRKSGAAKVDKFFGMLLGFLEGCVLVYLFLAILLLIADLGSPDQAATIAQTLEESRIAGILYENNLLLFAAKSLMS